MQKFKLFVSDYQNSPEYRKPLAFGIAKIARGQKSAKPLCATFPVLNWGEECLGSYAVFMESIKHASPLYTQEEGLVSEAVYGIDKNFIQRALELYAPFLQEVLHHKNSHKNIQVILELTKALENNQLYTPLVREVHPSCEISTKEHTLGFSTQYHHNYHLVVIYADKPCQSLESVYMKLLALSLGKAPLRSLNLEGIFGLLPNVAWSGQHAYELEWLKEEEITLKMQDKYPCIDFIDKFPRYLMQVLPQADNIRLLDSAKTRFGAYLGKGGYTQMPGASYINFNAGVEGACMNEGRISSSVMVGEGTDIGGGASVLGVLSGGNSQPISIGKNCLLGANCVLGISLGDGCIVDAGIGVLAGTIFEITPQQAKELQKINPNFTLRDEALYKGKELSNLHGIHFRQESQSGKMIAFRSVRKIALNTNLHR
ncbi:tetrahydrodipicolinate N-succinyltransferase N-terminal domain-containing protein [Helicobacter baculiformis]|uniref:Tetrahydrodipicolinate N-succinyltransferase N-terminal domain-containing protein n=1 Tax=Helicobacter baculiformis TaxID=427351 RepID=A0ABV7ZG77_9HELI|nr:2,3,4,5-tetrahydropyridine-2,6-carboxylate N-succinyltransferase [Helicobacter baculiformis]